MRWKHGRTQRNGFGVDMLRQSNVPYWHWTRSAVVREGVLYHDSKEVKRYDQVGSAWCSADWIGSLLARDAVARGNERRRSTFLRPETDGNPGTLEEPFLTLERARDEIRTMKRSAQLPDSGVTVFLRGGKIRQRGTV